MSAINFKGKNSVWNHHLSVPYQILEKDKKNSLSGKNEDENLIIEGDNLNALKSLLPKYQNRIKCVYIDPPYNTGNENWVYNDKSNSPLIKEWLGKVVDKEDLVKHDKWLCMMTPRLNILKDLLKDDGVIFISIDDNEVHHLRQLMDEIFGEENFIANLIWTNKEGGGGSDSKHFKTKHEYILCYGKIKNEVKLIQEIVNEDSGYSNKDEHIKERGKYKLIKLNSFSIQYSQSLDYEIKAPDNLKIIPSENGKRACWRWSKQKFVWGLKNNFVKFKKDNKNNWIVYTKQYFKVDNKGDLITRTLPPLALIDKFSSTMATKQMEELFGKSKIFEYSKPYLLIKHLIKISANKNDIILDSFAGSGTTAHAVMELNKEDKGDRKFILIQMPEKIKKGAPAYDAGFRYIHEITRERIKKVIEKEKLPVGFSYLKLGPKIDADSLLSGELPTYSEFAKYVYYLATGKTMSEDKTIKEKDYFVGRNSDESIYLIYKQDFEELKKMAIKLDWAKMTNKKDSGKKIIYAPSCYIDDEHLEKFNIHFVSIPYNLFEKK